MHGLPSPLGPPPALPLSPAPPPPFQVAYDALISTMPLDLTLGWLGKSEWAEGLTHSSSHIIGIGGWVGGGGG